MIFKGIVQDIIYRNVENGYSVVGVDIDGRYEVSVGLFPLVAEGENIIIEGDWTDNARYGRQISVHSVQIDLPTNIDAMIIYLSSGLFKGVKITTATAIVNKFGLETFKVIENDPKRLSLVKGISFKRACEISNTFNERKDMQNAMIYLMSFDLTVNLAMKLFQVYGNNIRAILETNPYKLIKDVEGVGFNTADKIASRLGIEKDSKFRIASALVYVLDTVAYQNGHTYLKYEELISKTCNLLQLPEELYLGNIENIIYQEQLENNIIILEDFIDGKIVMEYSFYLLEKDIASKLNTLNKETNDILEGIEEDIENYQKANKIKLHDGQINAIKNCIGNGVNIITGGPGTGKTTILKCILKVFDSMHKTVALCAPTGRAAKRMSESTGYPAKTIHRMLGLTIQDDRRVFTYDNKNHLPYDVVICDEISMCDEIIFNYLLEALRPNARLILVGDKDQLPSVGAGNLLADLINSKCIKVSYLSQIFRQDATSLIVSNAHRINNGEMPEINNKSDDFFFSQKAESLDILDEVVELVNKRLPNYFGVDFKDIQVLCPVKKGLVGIENINKKLQASLNPKTEDKNEILFGDTIFREGDSVIHIENNYDLEWVSDIDGTVGTGIFNGERGIIQEINPRVPSITVLFEDNKVAVYTQKDFSQLLLSYAITVHKSQGSEFKIVVMVLTPTNPMMLTRNLLYTAITRAKERVVIVGSKQILAKMVHNNTIAKRNTKLLDFIQDIKCADEGTY